jgi:hypothetical protein
VASREVIAMMYLLLTIFVLTIVTAALVGVTYFMSLRLNWIPKARDEGQLQRFPNESILTVNAHGSGLITISDLDFETVDLISLNLPKLLVERRTGAYTVQTLTFPFATNSSLSWVQTKKTNIVHFPIRGRSDTQMEIFGMKREAALG